MPATAYLRLSVLSALPNDDRGEPYGRDARFDAWPRLSSILVGLDWIFSIMSLTVKLAALARRELLEAVDIPRNNGLCR
jgi:hypothetical protein